MRKTTPIVEILAPEDRFLTPVQVCARLGVSKNWLYDRVQQKQIPFHRFGRHLRFNESALNEWITEHAE